MEKMPTESYNLVDSLIEAILTIANDKQVVKILEPNVMQPLALERWMVTRTLQCLELIMEELNDIRGINTTGTGTIPSQE